jgi:Protein of unknown function (DUF2946)
MSYASRFRAALHHERILRPFWSMGVTRSRRVALTAWAGLISIWLAVVAPVVTQLLSAPGHDLPVAVLCTAYSGVVPQAPDQSTPHAHHAKTCGYCNLLAHHAPLAGGGFAAWAPSCPRAQKAGRVATSSRTLTLTRFELAHPRGPPRTVS